MSLFIKISLLVVMASCNDKSNVDTIACKQVEQRLDVIKNFVDGKDADTTLKRVEAISFLELLTGIQSQADGTEIGKLNPTQIDYNKWSEWYKVSRDKLYWNSEKQKVFIKKE